MRARVVAVVLAAVAGVALALLGAGPASASWEVGSTPDAWEIGGVIW